MPAARRSLYLLAYDIADPKRLMRVHRTVRACGAPLQYSVFLVPGTADEIEHLLADLADIINAAKDDIRVYPLPSTPDVFHYGRQWLAEGLQLLGDQPLADLLGKVASDPEQR